MGGGKKNKSKKTKTKAQKLADKRREEGKTISQVKAENKKSMQDAAAARNAKFNQTRVQTLGGKRTSFSKSEQKRITDAGYSVAGYSKAKPNVGAGTGAMVTADNAQYGNTFPSGAIGISEEGKAQAEANLAEKRLSAPGTYGTGMPSNPAYKGVGARETQPTGFANTKLPLAGGILNPLNSFTPEARMTMLSGYADAAVDAVNFGKNVLTAGYARDKFNIPKLPKFQDAGMQTLRNVSSVGLPVGQALLGNVGRFKAADEIAKMTLSNAAYKAGKVPQLTKTGITGVNPLTIAKAFTPQMVATGPTAGATIALNTAMAGSTTGDKVQAGGLNIGGSSAEASEGETTSGDPTGRSIVSKAKGLADFAFNDKTDFDNLGSGLFGKGIVTPQDVKSDIKTSINKIGPMETLAQGIEGFRDYNRIKNADDRALAFAENVNADQFAKVLRFADDSKAVQKAGENLETLTGQENVNLPSDFKAQIRNVIEGAQEVTGGIEQGKVNDRLLMKNRVDEINNLLANVNQNPKLSTLSKVAGQFDPKTNPNADNMTSLQKIAAGFDSSSPNALALSATDRGLTGSGGNLLIGGKMSDIYRQATGNIEGGVNAGIPKGQVGLSNADMFNVATSAIKNIKTPGTLSAKQADSIQRTISGGVSPGSLIRGALPRFGGRTGSSGATNTTNTMRGTGTTAPATTPEELLIPQTPTYTAPTQTGTDTSNLQQIQQQSYMQNLAQLGITNLMQLPQFRTQQQRAPRRFRSFRRDYF